MSVQFSNLLSPIKLGGKTVKNRIMNPGHLTGFAVDNKITDRLIAYHVARAKGGLGLIVTASTSVHPSYDLFRGSGMHIYNHDDSVIPQLRKLADAVHEYDTVILEQISHGGAAGVSGPMLPLLSPSTDIYETKCEMTRTMEIDEIKEIVQSFGQAARRAEAGEMDGVEILNAYGNLIPQFMTPLSNRRTDEYGGSLENRLRFPLEIIDSVRENTGSDFIVGMRISGDELVEDGLTLEDMKEIAPMLAPKLDYINVSYSSHVELMSEGIQITPMALPLGSFVYLAAGIKEVVDIPVVAVGRINDPVQAEKIIADGYADMVAMARALICDPDLPNKAREGRPEDVRTCIACNQACAGHVNVGASVTCIQYPVTGKEMEWSTVAPAANKKKVVVVGGGPAGMEAAWAAARRGHQVVLYEKGEQLGGQVLIAAKAPFRADVGDVARNLNRQLELEKERVTVKLGVEATAQMVLAENPDVVITATGSTPFIPPLAGVDGTGVVTDWDVLEEKVETGQRVVVLDGEGGHRACSVAEFLVDKGKEVTIITKQFQVGERLITPDDSLVLQRLLQKKVVLKPLTWVREIKDSEVVSFHTLTKEEEIIPADNVVLALGGQSDYGLYRELKGKVKELYAVGDCQGPRSLEPAIYEGFSVGISL
ncbi:FAD-dependent oxidoreductase [Chloroflexota bacterium]